MTDTSLLEQDVSILKLQLYELKKKVESMEKIISWLREVTKEDEKESNISTPEDMVEE